MFAASKTASVSGGYQISRSLRFNSADSAYLNRTPASASNRKTWTFSAWVKLSALTGNNILFSASNGSSTQFYINFSSANTLDVVDYSGSTQLQKTTTQVFRDPSAFYHLVVVLDTTQASASNRFRLYINGVEVTAFSGTNITPSQNYDGAVNSTVPHAYGRDEFGDNNYYSGYLTETYLIDGQQLTPSSFGETNAQTGVWQPKAYSGSYGTNGAYLNFSDNSNTTAATLGKDYSGNGNNWTPNNFSVTAGAGNDSLVDSPTSFGTDTGVGGSVRGNYSTLNPLNKGGTHTLTNGNLDFSISGATGSTSTFGTIGVSSGKWYWEMLVASTDGSYYPGLGVETNPNPALQSGGTSTGFMYLISGQKYNNGSLAAYGSSYTTNDVIGVALDMDAGTITFYKNNTSQGQAFSGITGTAFPTLIGQTGGSGSFNFGQRAFAYTAPSGFKALCTQNLPTPTIGATTATQAGKYFNPATYTGNGSTNSITTVGFQPDWTWLKNRSVPATAGNHFATDAVRGAGIGIYPNLTDAEANNTTLFTGFTSTGFNVAGTNSSLNENGVTYVSWNWKANGSGSTNTAGSITSTVSANTTSGFSVVTYTGTGANATVGHGLGVAPSMVITKSRSDTGGWAVYHISAGASYYLLLNGTSTAANEPTLWNNTAPTATVFSLGTSGAANTSAATYVAYCFAPIAGYSAFGSYTGNGSADGPFVYCGFRPRYVMIKDSQNSFPWIVVDTARNTYNVMNAYLKPNASDAEATNFAQSSIIDVTANGFKTRTSDDYTNVNGSRFIFAAFAEFPFKYSLAR